jgi:hypothetical protein
MGKMGLPICKMCLYGCAACGECNLDKPVSMSISGGNSTCSNYIERKTAIGG